MLDSTGSLTQTGFNQELQFISSFVGAITIGPTNSRMALTEFGDTSTQQWTFTSTAQTTANLQSKINALPYWAQSTNITGAIQTSIPGFASQSRHLTPTTCIPRVDILVTDGRQNIGYVPPSVPAQQLRGMGVAFYAVGIGPDASLAQLTTITGNPNQVFMVDYATLQQTVAKLVAATCATQSQTCTDTVPAPVPVPPIDYYYDYGIKPPPANPPAGGPGGNHRGQDGGGKKK